MPSNSKNVYCANNGTYAYVMNVSWSESSPSVNNNTSIISASGSMNGQYVGFQSSGYSYYLHLYWHDDRTNKDTLFASSGAFSSMGYQSGGGRSVSGSITVTHKDNGALNGYVWMRFESPSTSGGWAPSTTDLTTPNTALTTIARASSISTLTGSALASAVTVGISRKVDSFTHKVEWSFEGSAWATASSNAGTSASFTPAVSLATRIPNATSGTMTVRVTTFNGSTQIGSSVTKSIALSVPSSVVPTMGNPTATRVDNGVPAAWGVYVQGISKTTISIVSAAGAQGSTIKSYSITGPGVNSTSSSVTTAVLANKGNQTYTCTITDSRGRTASKTVTINVVEYTGPSLKVSAERCNSSGVVTADGTYLKVVVDWTIASVSGKNSVAARSVTCNGVSNTTFADNAAFTLGANCSIGSSYTLTATIKDALNNTFQASVQIQTAARVMNVRSNKKGLAIGKFSQLDAFEVAWPAKFYDRLQIPFTKDLIDSGVPYAGVGPGLTDMTQLAEYRSMLGALTLGSTWNNIISVRHRNGYADGNNFGMYLRSALTSNSSLYYRQQLNGTWQGERMIMDSWNYPEATKRYHYVISCPSGGGARWVHIGDFPNNPGARTHAIRIYTGNGWNGRSDQNTEIEIRIKPAAENYGTTFWVNGYYHNGIQVRVYTQSTSTPCQLWVYFPWAWYSGNVEVYTEGSFSFNGGNQTGAPAQSANTANAPVANITPDMRGHPVGSIFRCNNGSITNPANVMGGTWKECRVTIANSQNTNYVVDNAGNVIANSNNIGLYGYNGSTSQLWYLQSVQKDNGTRHDVREWIRTQ